MTSFQEGRWKYGLNRINASRMTVNVGKDEGEKRDAVRERKERTVTRGVTRVFEEGGWGEKDATRGCCQDRTSSSFHKSQPNLRTVYRKGRRERGGVKNGQTHKRMKDLLDLNRGHATTGSTEGERSQKKVPQDNVLRDEKKRKYEVGNPSLQHRKNPHNKVGRKATDRGNEGGKETRPRYAIKGKRGLAHSALYTATESEPRWDRQETINSGRKELDTDGGGAETAVPSVAGGTRGGGRRRHRAQGKCGWRRSLGQSPRRLPKGEGGRGVRGRRSVASAGETSEGGVIRRALLGC